MNFRTESAKIYAFPRRIAPSAGGPRREGAPIVELRAPREPEIVFGNAWYHEAAVQDARRINKP